MCHKNVRTTTIAFIIQTSFLFPCKIIAALFFQSSCTSIRQHQRVSSTQWWQLLEEMALLLYYIYHNKEIGLRATLFYPILFSHLTHLENVPTAIKPRQWKTEHAMHIASACTFVALIIIRRFRSNLVLFLRISASRPPYVSSLKALFYMRHCISQHSSILS